MQEVSARTKETYAFYNNHYGAKAIVNAVQLDELLGQPLQKPLPEPLLESFPDILK